MKPSMVKDAAGLEAIRTGRLIVDALAGMIWRLGGERAEAVRSDAYGVVYVGNGMQVMAHRLVWMAANGPIPEGMIVNHKNGKRWDNRIDNLEVLTPANNVRHGALLGPNTRRFEHYGSLFSKTSKATRRPWRTRLDIEA